MKLYIQHGAKLIVNQLGCLYRHFGANSDGVACFLICTSLTSQQNGLFRLLCGKARNQLFTPYYWPAPLSYILY
jgi:hypothetical protein